jgi:hypothetical protein
MSPKGNSKQRLEKANEIQEQPKKTERDNQSIVDACCLCLTLHIAFQVLSLILSMHFLEG